MNIQKMMQQAQAMQSRMEQELAAMKVEASSGGGMVTVTANGQGEIVGIKLAKEAVDPDDVEMLEDLIVVAVADAQKKAMDEAKLRTGKLTEGLPIKLPF